MSASQNILLVAVLVFIAGCATTDGDSYPDYLSRAVSRNDGPIHVKVSALTPLEAASVYGVPLAARDIQPVWLEVENRDSTPYWFLPHGMDPGFFPHWEAAEAFSIGEGDLFNEDRRQLFESLSFPNIIPAGTTVSGFVLTVADEGFKFVHTDFIQAGKLREVSFVVDVPGFRADYLDRGTFHRARSGAEDVTNYEDDLAGFRSALEALPCCVTNKKGTRLGDPVNLVVIGDVNDAFSALAERGWRPTETTWSGSVFKMMASALSGEPYLYAPISPLYLYDRPQDIALQRSRDNIHQRNHLRLWLAPMRFRGKPVWVGQISRDIGSRLTIHSPYLTTHKIDPDVDEARSALLEDIAYSHHLMAFGGVAGVGEASAQSPRGNLTTDPYYADGKRAVLLFDVESTPMDKIDFLEWLEENFEYPQSP